jgi:hypothetical protein
LPVAHRENLVIRLDYTANEVVWRQTSLQAYRDNWAPWPPLRH